MMGLLRADFLARMFDGDNGPALRLSDPGVKEALFDIASMRSFAQIDLGNAAVPDETTAQIKRFNFGRSFESGDADAAENAMTLPFLKERA